MGFVKPTVQNPNILNLKKQKILMFEKLELENAYFCLINKF